MFMLALLIGIYSYVVFFLGILGLLYKSVIIFITGCYIIGILFSLRNRFNPHGFKNKIINYFNKTPKIEKILLLIIFFQASINLLGVLGSEFGFDALWYHLTLPKIYLINHAIDYIPGGLLYYSTMPKLGEMLYIFGLSLGNDIFPKLIHFSFGILSLIALYKLSRKFLSSKLSLLACVIFYSNLVVGWMSITAYIDLARTFFEIMVLWGFLNWLEEKKVKWLVISAIMLGLTISTKLLAIGSLIIFTVLMLNIYFQSRKINLRFIIAYWAIALFIPLPWFIFSFIHTGNPFYPFFTNIYPVKFNLNLTNPLSLSDPISPLYVVLIPLAVIFYRKFNPMLRVLLLYSVLAIIIWYITPQTGGGRFILPYLPVLSILSVAVIGMMRQRIRNIFIILIIFLALFSIFYRFAANLKYIPVILGKETKAHFLSNHLNFSFGDFYDVDGYFAKTIKSQDKVLLYGFHNLYYVNFPFIDSSYVKKGDTFNYIAVSGNNLPDRFKMWNLIYLNSKTNVRLYSIGGIKWVY